MIATELCGKFAVRRTEDELVELDVGAEVKLAFGSQLQDGLDGLYKRLRDTPKPVWSPASVGTGSSASSSTVPFQIDLGEPPPGRFWELTAVVTFGSDDHTVVAGDVALYAGSMIVGSVPSLGQLILPLITIPFFDDIGGRRLLVQPGERLIANVSGVANSQVVGVKVFKYEWRQDEVLDHCGR